LKICSKFENFIISKQFIEKLETNFLETIPFFAKTCQFFRYKEQNPEEEKDDGHHNSKKDENPEDYEVYEDDEEGKELQLIFADQSLTRTTIAKISKGLDEVLGKHEAISTAVCNLQMSLKLRLLIGLHNFYFQIWLISNFGNISAFSGKKSATLPIIERYEVENIFAANQELLGITGEIK
jgi:hypothetical protein